MTQQCLWTLKCLESPKKSSSLFSYNKHDALEGIASSMVMTKIVWVINSQFKAGSLGLLHHSYNSDLDAPSASSKGRTVYTEFQMLSIMKEVVPRLTGASPSQPTK